MKKRRVDIFGKRYRLPYLEDAFGVSSLGMKTFQALRTKLLRDYLTFFRSLEKTYQIGKFKGEAKAASNLVVSTIRLVDQGIKSGAPKKEEVENIIANIDSLNAQKDFFVNAAKEIAPIQKRLVEIEEETGISPKALSITEEIVRRGVKVEKAGRREARKGAFRRAMPRTMALGAELGKGVAAAALGPLYPIAEMLGVPIKEAFGFGRKAFRRSRERKLGEQLEPMARGYPTEELERGAALRRAGLPVLEVSGVSRRGPITIPLREFFDKEAYRAKWTKELLQKIKDLGKVRGRDREGGLSMLGLSGLTEKFAGLGAGLLPLIGKAGLLLVLAGAITFTTIELTKLGKVTKEYWDTLKRVSKSREKQEKLQEGVREKEAGIYARRLITGGTLEERTKARTGLLRVQKEREKALREEATKLEITKPGESASKLASWWLSGVRSIFRRGETPTGRMEPPPTGSIGPLRTPTTEMREQSEQISKLTKTMETLSNRIQNIGQPQSNIKGPGLGNPFDSADSLLRGLTSGNLALGER